MSVASGESFDLNPSSVALPTAGTGDFDPAYRAAVDELARSSKFCADLAGSFPGLLFALATGYGTAQARAAARSLVESGAPLREAAGALGLPVWTRGLPAGAFAAPLRRVPGNGDLANFIPGDPGVARTWLWAVCLAGAVCDDEFALWTAGWAGKHHRVLSLPAGLETFHLLAGWAWFAGQPGTRGHRLIKAGWHPRLGLRRALDGLALWRRRIALDAQLCARAGEAWIKGASVGALEFVPLASAEDFIAEAEAMDNCLDQFSDRLQSVNSRVYSIRKNGRPVANVEIGVHEEDATMPAILQLRGPRNRRAAPELWQAAYAWLGAQALRPAPHTPQRVGRMELRPALRAIWKPYLEHLERLGLEECARAVATAGDLATAPRGAPASDRCGLLSRSHTRPRSRKAARPASVCAND